MVGRADVQIAFGRKGQSERGMSSHIMDIEKARMNAGGREERKNSEQMPGAGEEI